MIWIFIPDFYGVFAKCAKLSKCFDSVVHETSSHDKQMKEIKRKCLHFDFQLNDSFRAVYSHDHKETCSDD